MENVPRDVEFRFCNLVEKQPSLCGAAGTQFVSVQTVPNKGPKHLLTFRRH